MSAIESTTFTLDAVGRYIFNKWEEPEASGDPLGIDVVVIGSGMYGGYTAARTWRKSTRPSFVYELEQNKANWGVGPGRKPLRVLVLESGPFIAPTHMANLPDMGLWEGREGSGFRPGWGLGWNSNVPYTGQAYCVGGKSLWWGGWSPQLRTADLQYWPKEMASYMTDRPFRKPADPEDAERVIKGAYNFIQAEIGAKETSDFIWGELKDSLQLVLNNKLAVAKAEQNLQSLTVTEAPIAVEAQSELSGVMTNSKYSSLPELIRCVRNDRAAGGKRITIVPNTHVRKLVVQDGHVRAIELTYHGQKKTLPLSDHAQVVLAASAIESTRIALESFSLVGTGVRKPEEGELMGQNLHTHLRFDFPFRFKREVLERLRNEVKPSSPEFKFSKLLQTAALHVEGLDASGLEFQYQLFSSANQSLNPDEVMYRTVGDLDVLRDIAKSQDSEHISVILRGSGQMRTNRSPNRDGNTDFVVLDDNDYDYQNDHKKAWVQWSYHDNDEVWQTQRETAIAISRLFADGADTVEYLVNGQWGSEPPPLDILRQGLGTTYHDAGTLWMGDDPNTSITDTNGHFHHIANAYVVDQAAHPDGGVANPVPTGLVVARKTAADIIDRHSTHKPNSFDLKDEAAFNSIWGDFAANWQSTPGGSLTLVDKPNDGDSRTWVYQTERNGDAGVVYFKTQEFTDFELRIQWKAFRNPAGPTAKSAILLRAPLPTSPLTPDFYDKSIQIQIDDSGYDPERNIYGSSKHKTGAIYGVSPATQWASKAAAPDGYDGYWNEYKIVVKGNSVDVKLNHKSVSSVQELPPQKQSKGYIALQFNTGRVQFTNVRVKAL